MLFYCRSFSGCISSFSISKKEIPLYMIEESKNVYYGKCSENVSIILIHNR